MKQDFQFSMNRVSVNVNLMKVYVIQIRNGIMMNASANVKD